MSYYSSRRNSRYEDRWPAYVPVAERRRKAVVAMEKLRKKGHPVAPVKIEGRAIATTFWGKAWCDNLERYRDYENRIERGRTYVRNGSVVDLQIAPREVTAMVSGSELYQVKISIGEVPKKLWGSICKDCSGGIDSLVELLQGRFSKGVMERICRQGDGLFPKPSEIRFSCSCPDHASMCKHVAAVLYGVGARLDQKPELLFQLRAVDETDLLAQLDTALPLAKGAPEAGKMLAGDDLSALFGLEMDAGQPAAAAGDAAPPRRKPARASQPADPKPSKVAPQGVAKGTARASAAVTRATGKSLAPRAQVPAGPPVPAVLGGKVRRAAIAVAAPPSRRGRAKAI
jgi:uncharacterized Zn finger protein